MSDYAALNGTESRASKGPERALAILLVAGATLAVAAAAILVVPPAMRITRYEISGNASMTREELLSAALIHEKEYFLSLDAARVEAAIAAEPRVASASVTKLFPNGLRIAVKERKAVASALVSIGGRASVACLDTEGVAFAEASPEEAASVPVLSGLRFEDFRIGTRLPPAIASLLSAIGRIQASEPALLAAISEIRIVVPSAVAGATSLGAFELLVYPLNQRIPVRAGASLDASTLRSIILVLDVLGTKGMAASVQEIDFRTGTVVYRSKEGQSG
jgi:cell division septal protein FtsQ